LGGDTNISERNENEPEEEPTKGRGQKGKRGKQIGKTSEPKTGRGRKRKSSEEPKGRLRSSSPKEKAKKGRKGVSASETHRATRDKKKISDDEYDKYSHLLDKKTKRKTK
jgi:hypothetical protein